MLLNECVAIDRGRALIYLAGVDDAHFYRADNIEKAAADNLTSASHVVHFDRPPTDEFVHEHVALLANAIAGGIRRSRTKRPIAPIVAFVPTPVAKRRAIAARELEKLRKKGRKISPVVIEGRTIAEPFGARPGAKISNAIPI